jgi:hypothetical protein
MKKIYLFAFIGAALLTLVSASASIWEGPAEVGKDLPETGYYAATNSLPVNSIVDITNLENGKMIRLIVTSGLESSGILALLSKDAADALEIKAGSSSRIRMSESADPAALSRIAEGRVLLSNPDQSRNGTSKPESAGNERIEGGERFIDLPDELPIRDLPIKQGSAVPEGKLTLTPAENRPPEKGPLPDSDDFVPGIRPQENPSDPAQIDSARIIDQIRPPARSSFDFSELTISSFEKGKYYVQIGAYSKTESVKNEISKIDKNLPVAIMSIGSAEEPVYRVLIGPVSLGESGALLQRYRGVYKDAFVWLGK